MSPLRKYIPFLVGAVSAVFAALIGGLWNPPFFPVHPDDRPLAMFLGSLPSELPDPGTPVYLAHFLILVAGAFFAGAGVSRVALWYPAPTMKDTQTGGPEVIRDDRKAIRAFRRISRSLKADGIEIVPGLVIPRHVESEHLLIAGSAGAGKTQTISKIIGQAISRGDRLVILDPKGDYTAWLADPACCTVLSPLDCRTPAWIIGRDVSNEQEFKALAEALVEDDGSKDRIWTESARAIMVGAMMDLHAKKPGVWTFRDLDLALDKANILKSAEKYAKRFYDTVLKDEQNETGLSVLFSLYGMAGNLSALYGSSPEVFSVRDWIEGKGKQILILQQNPLMLPAFKLSSRMIMMMLYAHVMRLPDSRDRRIWVFLDEMAVLGKFEALIDFLERGRSKGLCVLGGIQDWGTIEESFGAKARSLFTNFNSKLFMRLSDPKTAEYYSDSLGEITFERRSQSTSVEGRIGHHPTATLSVDKVNEPAVSPTELMSIPAPDGKWVYGWVRIPGYPIGRTRIPIQGLPAGFPMCVPVPGKQTGSAGGSSPPGKEGSSVRPDMERGPAPEMVPDRKEEVAKEIPSPLPSATDRSERIETRSYRKEHVDPSPHKHGSIVKTVETLEKADALATVAGIPPLFGVSAALIGSLIEDHKGKIRKDPDGRTHPSRERGETC